MTGAPPDEVHADAHATDADVAAARRLLPRGRSHAVDRLADLAARLLGTPSAQVSLLTDNQTVAGAAGAAAGDSGRTSPLADSLCTVTATARAPLVVADAVDDERVSLLPPVVSGAVRSYLGVPLLTDRGDVVGALCVYDAAPREWSDRDVEVLRELAPPVLAELELGALAGEYESDRERWQLAIDAAGVGGFDWDLVSTTLVWDERLIELFGYDAATFDRTIEAFEARLHPDDLERVRQALRDAIDGCTTYDAEFRIVLPDGMRWVQARGKTICDGTGTPVRLIGAAYDTTIVREGEARVARILESMSAAFFSLDREWRFTYVNAQAERLLERSRDDLLGDVLWDLFPAAVGSDFERHYRSAVETGVATSFEAYYPAPLKAWYEVRAWPAPDGLSVYFLDITERRAAQDRVTLLADVTTALAETLDPTEAVRRLARLVVPSLGDWCIVSLIDGEHAEWRRGLEDVAWWHRDPAVLPALERYAKRRVPGSDDSSFLARALRQRRPVVLHDMTAQVSSTLRDEEAKGLLRSLAPEWGVVQPVRARGRTLGLLTLCWTEPGEPDPVVLGMLSEIAARAGLAFDNARLYDQQRHLAEGLQRSLLTAPPEPDHMQIVVRYEPSAEVAQVGGDWYDAFLQPHGATMLVIGDVIGHDAEAAAAMGQVRGLLRGIASTTGDGPAGVLGRLDAAMELLQVATTATALVARFEQSDDERARGLTRMRWSNAGHPPPLAINPDGSVIVLSDLFGLDADLLLGIDPTSARRETEVALDRGATVLLYTDGLVERRGQGLDEGVAALRDLLVELGGLPLDDLCDAVLDRMLPAEREDDVALAAVRLHPQDRPRPTEAGPNRVPPTVEPEP